MSAKTGQGLEELKRALLDVIRRDQIYVERLYDFSEAGKIQLIRTRGQLVSEEYLPEGIEVKAYVPRDIYGEDLEKGERDHGYDRQRKMYRMRALREGLPGRKDCCQGGKKQYIHRSVSSAGHCVAVCPRAAVSIPEYDMDDVEEYDAETFRIDPEHFLHAVKFRRSIRSFRDRKIDRACMERILQAGRYTPTAKNSQSCRFYRAAG